ncbi:site-specific integrase [Bacillus wiedmannii]|uniref:site-specific integrase n=1 Tax=Bacillus wiedmannii TaxID=1890302 RepID=UPI003CF05E24
MLIDKKVPPIVPVVKYLKYLDSTGKSRNTQKTYYYALKQYFIYLREPEKDYKEIKLEDWADFIGWLGQPYNRLNIACFYP